MTPLIFGISSLVFLLLGLAILLIGYNRYSKTDVTDRLADFVNEDQNRLEDRIAADIPVRNLTGSFTSRVLMPVFRRIVGFLGRLTPAGAIERIDRQLMLAGYPIKLGPREFYGLRVALMILGAYLGITFITRGTDRLNLVLGIASPLVSFLLPQLWLMSRVNSRQDKIRKGLPDALDMLSVCATAGLGFDQSLQRVSDYWKSDVGIEFGRTIREMSMGISRSEALRNLSDRVDIVELSSFVTLIIQSDQLGMSIADTLHAQADQMRLFRRLRAEEEIRKIPVKLLIPIGIFIFPAIIAVILGPSVPVLLDFFRDF